MSSPHIPFKWDHEGGSVYFRLYENGELIVNNIAEPYFDVLMKDKEYGDYDYHVTAVRKDFDIESAPSNTYTVNFTQPAAPTNLRVENAETSVSGSVG
jgi:hypothetical protein